MLEDLKKGLIRKALVLFDKEQYIEAYKVFELVNESEIKKLKDKDAFKISKLYLRIGKLLFSKKKFPKSLEAFNLSRSLMSDNPLLLERIKLLEVLFRDVDNVTKKKMDFSSFCSILGVISQRCRNQSNLSFINHLLCLKIINPHKDNLLSSFLPCPIELLYLGSYKPRKRDDKWSGIIRSLKESPSKEYAAALSKVMAEFLFNQAEDNMKDIDLIIPVPPNPSKYTNRGFAPTDLLTGHLSRDIAMPLCKDLVRTIGKDTREANEREIQNWYSLNEKGIKYVKGNHILLVDDVSTRGYSLNACSNKLLKAGANNVTCMVLGRTGG